MLRGAIPSWLDTQLFASFYIQLIVQCLSENTREHELEIGKGNSDVHSLN
jgi:hypothetical protein